MSSLKNPVVGAKGLWKLKEPFNNYLPVNTALTCTAVSNYGQCLAMGIDPYMQYYRDRNIDQTTYQEHFDGDGRVIFLKSDNGSCYSFPLHYLISFPIGTGVNYANMGLGIRLGALPIDTNLELLCEQIKELCHLNIGTTSKVNVMVLSEINIIENAEHERLTNARKAKKKAQTPTLEKIANLTDTNKEIAAKLKIAEAKVLELYTENQTLKNRLNASNP